MADLTEPDAQCRAKVGMLVLRDCGGQAVVACDACGRPLCRGHQCPVAEGVNCPECAARDESAARVGPAKTARRRRRYYRSYGYRPYYHWGYGHGHHHHYYSDDDYRTFDRAEPGEAGSPAEGAPEEAGALAAEADDPDAEGGLDDDFGPGDFDES